MKLNYYPPTIKKFEKWRLLVSPFGMPVGTAMGIFHFVISPYYDEAAKGRLRQG
jgi:hypothetical protein